MFLDYVSLLKIQFGMVFVLAFAFTKYNNFADYVVSEIWQFGLLNKLSFYFSFESHFCA